MTFNNSRAVFQQLVTDSNHTTGFLIFPCFDDTCNFELSSGFKQQSSVTIQRPQRCAVCGRLDENDDPIVTKSSLSSSKSGSFLGC